MKKISAPLALVLCVIAICGGLFGGGGAKAQSVAPLNVSWTWTLSEKCGVKSPAFTIGNIPTDTKTLKFVMVDLDAPMFNHGGGTVAYSGSDAIPAGAFTYKGPCPPDPHKYEFTVTTINAAGATIGRGKAVRSFPP